jgi:hypothetical protein
MDLGELLFMYQGQAGCVSSVPAKKALQPSREAHNLLKREDVSELFFGQLSFKCWGIACGAGG